MGDNAVPDVLVYDGEDVSSVVKATARNLTTGLEYMFGFKAKNKAGWSMLSAVLTTRIGNLPSPPPKHPVPTSTSQTSIVLSWEPSTSSGGGIMDKYYIYQDGVKIADVPANTLTYTVSSGLLAGSSYKFSISSLSNIGEGPKSHDFTMWAIDTPSAPTLSVSSATRDQCHVSWASVTPPANSKITGYVVLGNNGLDGDVFTTLYDGGNNPSALLATLNNLKSRRTYKLKVYATNKAGNGAESTVQTCYTAAKPGQPGRAIMTTSTATSITVKWDPAYDDGGAPITGYQVYTDIVEGDGIANIETWVLSHNGDGNTLTKIIGSLTSKKLYRFRVRAISETTVAGDYSPISEYYSAALPPTIVFNTASFVSSKNSIKIMWTKPTLGATDMDIMSYRLYWNEGYKT